MAGEIKKKLAFGKCGRKERLGDASGRYEREKEKKVKERRDFKEFQNLPCPWNMENFEREDGRERERERELRTEKLK